MNDKMIFLKKLKNLNFKLTDFDFTLEEYRQAGYTINDLVNKGFNTKPPTQFIYIEGSYAECYKLIDAGYTQKELKEFKDQKKNSNIELIKLLIKNGFNKIKLLEDLRCFKIKLNDCNFTFKEFKQAGYSVYDLISHGFNIKNYKKNYYVDLINAGYTFLEINKIVKKTRNEKIK